MDSYEGLEEENTGYTRNEWKPIDFVPVYGAKTFLKRNPGNGNNMNRNEKVRVGGFFLYHLMTLVGGFFGTSFVAIKGLESLIIN